MPLAHPHTSTVAQNGGKGQTTAAARIPHKVPALRETRAIKLRIFEWNYHIQNVLFFSYKQICKNLNEKFRLCFSQL